MPGPPFTHTFFFLFLLCVCVCVRVLYVAFLPPQDVADVLRFIFRRRLHGDVHTSGASGPAELKARTVLCRASHPFRKLWEQRHQDRITRMSCVDILLDLFASRVRLVYIDGLQW